MVKKLIIFHLFWKITRFSFVVMLRKVLRLIVSLTLILSIGYSQLFLVYSLGAFTFGSSTSDQPVKAESRAFHFSPKVKSDHSADQQNQDWESEVLEKDPDEYAGAFSLELQLALSAVFLFLLSVSFGAYRTRFLRFYRHFFFIFPHRLHLYNGVFTI